MTKKKVELEVALEPVGDPAELATEVAEEAALEEPAQESPEPALESVMAEATPLDEDLAQAEEPAVVEEPLLSVRANQSFRDGAFTNDFAPYGYSLDWPAGQVRQVPVFLFKKLNARSGNKFSVVIEK